jgi:hypothetical protein
MEGVVETVMHFGRFKFGSIQIDGATYDYDVVIDGGSIRKRKKKPSIPDLVRPRHFPPQRTYPGAAGGS